MNHKSIRLVAVAGALVLSACIAVDATAQCCGGGGWGGGWGTTSYYAPSYQTYDTGWYPGYWWNRVSARLWGSPTTYVAAYPGYSGCTTCGTSGWWPSSSCGGGCSSCGGGCSTCAGYSPCSSCSSCSAGYAPCSSCSSCNSGYVTSYAPSCGCSTCGSSCPSNCGCSNCASGSAVSQISYQQQPGCNCSSNAAPPPAYVAPPAAVQQQPQPTPAAQPNAGAGDPAPDYNANRPPTDISPPANGVQPEPGAETEQKDPYDVNKSDSGAYFEAPKLFNPRDRTARSTSIAPVRTAVYQQPVAYRQTSSAPRAPVTAEQARKDAIGWTSGTN